MACVKIRPDGRRETWVKGITPGMPIPAGSTAIHGIRDADVEALPRFADVAAELAAFLEGCDLGGYNITGFDLPALRTEFLPAGIGFEIAPRRPFEAQRHFFSPAPR